MDRNYVNGFPLRGPLVVRLTAMKNGAKAVSRHVILHPLVSPSAQKPQKCDIRIIVMLTLGEIYFEVQGTSEYFLSG